MKTASKKLLKVPYYILIVCVAAVGLLLLGTLIPIPGNIKVKIVKSGSMEPAIKTGGIVVIKPGSVYQTGDVITFGADSKTQIPTTHRIVEVKGATESQAGAQTFVTKGDANGEIDPKETKQSEVSGKVVWSAPYLGYILDFAKKPLGFILIVGIPAGMIIFDEIVKIWREVKKIRNRRKKKDSRLVPVNSVYDIPDDDSSGDNILDLRIRKVADFATRPRRAVDGKSSGSHSGEAHLRMLMAVLLVIGSAIGYSKIGGTISYYNQTELSLSNRFQASSDYGQPEIDAPLIDALSFSAKSIQEDEPEVESVTEPIIETETQTEPETEAEETSPEVIEETAIETPAETVVETPEESSEQILLPIQIIDEVIEEELIS